MESGWSQRKVVSRKWETTREASRSLPLLCTTRFIPDKPPTSDITTHQNVDPKVSSDTFDYLHFQKTIIQKLEHDGRN